MKNSQFSAKFHQHHSIRGANDSPNAIEAHENEDALDDNELEPQPSVHGNNTQQVIEGDGSLDAGRQTHAVQSDGNTSLGGLQTKNTVGSNANRIKSPTNQNDLIEMVQDSDPLHQIESQHSQIKKEPAFDGSIIDVSNDSMDGLMTNDSEFADLQNLLAYDSDDDIDEAIQKEFDYLVSLGKLPAPIIVKVEESDTSVASVQIAA